MFSQRLVAHLMLTAEGFGFDLHRLKVVSLRATSIPYVHPGHGGPAEQFARLRDLL